MGFATDVIGLVMVCITGTVILGVYCLFGFLIWVEIKKWWRNKRC